MSVGCTCVVISISATFVVGGNESIAGKSGNPSVKGIIEGASGFITSRGITSAPPKDQLE